MLCPVCNSEMYDQSKSKYPRKEGSPDFKCRDKDCKWKMDRDTGEWVESEYTTAVWLPKPPAPKKPAPRPASKPFPPARAGAAPVTEHAKKEMLISYAKDIVCAEIAKGIEVKEPFKRVADGFKVLMMAYTHPFGKPPAPKPAPKDPMLDQMEDPSSEEDQPAEDHEGVPF